MTFISGARITEKHQNGAGWHSWLCKQMSLQPPLKCVQWQAAVTQCWWQTVPHCGPVEGEVALTCWRLYSWQVDTSSRCWLQSRTSLNFLHRHTKSCRYGGAMPRMYFHMRTAGLKMILRCTGSQWRLHGTGVMWSRRRAPDTKWATIFYTDCSSLILDLLIHFMCAYVFVTGRHQNLQAEVTRLNEREASMQSENQHLQEKIIHLEKVSHIPVVAAEGSAHENMIFIATLCLVAT